MIVDPLTFWILSGLGAVVGTLCLFILNAVTKEGKETRTELGRLATEVALLKAHFNYLDRRHGQRPYDGEELRK
jgi:hypothetical protein